MQSLRDIIRSLASLSEPKMSPPRTAQQTLELVSTASKLLSHVNDSPSINGLEREPVSNIIQVLNELTIQLSSSVRKEKANLIKGLYVIIDPRVTGGRNPLTIAQASVRGGASMLQ